MFVVVDDRVVTQIRIQDLKGKELHFYNKKYVLWLKGDKNYYINSRLFAPILKLFLAIDIKQ